VVENVYGLGTDIVDVYEAKSLSFDSDDAEPLFG
jgi:hypothetical protein